MGPEGLFSLLELKLCNTDVSGGARAPPLVQLMHTYVCTHGHRTRHDPLHRTAGRPGRHDIAQDKSMQQRTYSTEHAQEARRTAASNLLQPSGLAHHAHGTHAHGACRTCVRRPQSSHIARACVPAPPATRSTKCAARRAAEACRRIPGARAEAVRAARRQGGDAGGCRLGGRRRSPHIGARCHAPAEASRGRRCCD